MLDYVIDVEVYTCIYPLMSFLRQDNELYALQDLVYEGFYSFGIFVTSFFLGKFFFTYPIQYNTYCLIASILLFLSFFILKFTNLTSSYSLKKETDNHYDLFSFLKQIRRDKISLSYFLFTFFGEASYACIMEMVLILLTEVVGFSPQFSSNFLLIMGFVALAVGGLILKFLTLKSDYLNLLIKYGGRIVFYFAAFLSGSSFFLLLSIFYAKLFTDSYVHVTDAPYVNRFSKNKQFAFLNLNQMVTYFGIAIGVLCCGLVLEYNVRYVFLLGCLFCLVQLFFGYRAIYLRNIEKGSGSNDRK